MIWNRPPQSQLDKYHKGGLLDDIFNVLPENRADCSVRTFENVVNVTSAHTQENSGFCDMFNAEVKCSEEVQVRVIEKENFERELLEVLKKLWAVQMKKKTVIFVTYMILTTMEVNVNSKNCSVQSNMRSSTKT